MPKPDRATGVWKEMTREMTDVPKPEQRQAASAQRLCVKRLSFIALLRVNSRDFIENDGEHLVRRSKEHRGEVHK